ncbi:Uncharacterized protein SCF082_LOCUS9271, partial [Durusdinium trenchii]
RLPPDLNLPGRKRYVKDALHVGEWFAGRDIDGEARYFVATHETLAELERNFAEMTAAGIPIPLRWGHGQGGVAEDDRDTIEDVAHLWQEDGILYFAVYLTDEQAAEVTRKHRRVSVRVLPSYRVTPTQAFGVNVAHVAIVDHAAVPNQMPFVQLEASPENTGEEVIHLDFAKTVEQVNRLLASIAPSAVLQLEGEAAVTEENFNAMLEQTLQTVLGEDGEQTETVESEEMALPEDLSAALAEALPGLKQEIVTDLSAALEPVINSAAERVAQQRKEEADKDAAKERFEAKLADLAAAGVPTAKIEAARKYADKIGYSDETFDECTQVIDLSASVSFGRKTGSLATGEAPEARNVGDDSPEEVEAARKALGLKSK